MMRVLAFALLLFVAGAPEARAQSITAALGQVATKIAEMQEVRGKSLAVGDFPLTTGVMSEIGSFLADQLDAVLTGRAASGGFKIVTRSHLCQVIRENKLWIDDRFDPELHKKRSEEHTSELQSPCNLVCRLLL